MKLDTIPVTVCAAILLAAAATADAKDLVRNADFSQKTDQGLPAEWSVLGDQKVAIDASEAPAGVGQSLRVDVVRDGGSSYGQIYQNVPAKPDTVYRLEGMTKSTKPELAFFSIKLRKDGDEFKRIKLPKSQTEWTETSQEFATGEADEIQVLCRWRQSAASGWVSQTGWFADVKLIEVGPAPPPPPWVVAAKQAAAIAADRPSPIEVESTGDDLYVTPEGAGRRDGSSWENALPGNAAGVLLAAWDALAPGKTCRIGSGVYVGPTLEVSSGGSGPDKMKRLLGEDTGGGPAWFVGDFDPDNPSKGKTLISLKNEVDYCCFENLKLVRYQNGIVSRDGRHTGLRVRNFDVYEGRFGLYLNGMAPENTPELASHDMRIEDCEFIHFTKSAVRLQGGNYDVAIVNCTADAGGRDWMKESFQICYNLAGDLPRRLFNKEAPAWAAEHDILLINCVARNTIYSRDRYWQGDGFIAEGKVRNVAFINCQSYDHADGGWDVKADNVVYVNCIGMRSKMNWRIWRHALMHNCLSAYSFKRGGSWTTAGLWTTGTVHARRCTLHNNNVQQFHADQKERGESRRVATADVTLDRCIVSFDGVNSETERLYSEPSRITKIDTAEWQPTGDGPGNLDPLYVAAAESKAWTGTPPDAFDSRRYAGTKGYQSSLRAAWGERSSEELILAARFLLKHGGWDDFQRRVQVLSETPRGESWLGVVRSDRR